MFQLPFISPLLLTITPALSSKYKNTPSFLLKGFRCRMTTAGITIINDIKINTTCYIHLKDDQKNDTYLFYGVLAFLSSQSLRSCLPIQRLANDSNDL